MESARSAMLFRSTVATSVAIASMAALIPTLRFGPRRQPTIGARNDVAGNADRDDGGAAALDEALEGRGAISVAKRVHQLLERRRGDDAALAAGPGDRVVAIGELDREATGGDPERVVELARGG